MSLLNKVAKIYITTDGVEARNKVYQYTYGIIKKVRPNRDNPNSIVKFYEIKPLKTIPKESEIDKYLEIKNCEFKRKFKVYTGKMFKN